MSRKRLPNARASSVFGRSFTRTFLSGLSRHRLASTGFCGDPRSRRAKCMVKHLCEFSQKPSAPPTTRIQQPRKHLAIHASELAHAPNLKILRRPRSLLLRLDDAHRSPANDPVHCPPQFCDRWSIVVRIGLSQMMKHFFLNSFAHRRPVANES